MRLAKRIGIGLGALLLLAQIPAFCGEVAVLRNGFSIHFDRKEQTGPTTRLFLGGGYVDVASAEIASFQPDAPALSPVAQSPAAPKAQAAGRAATKPAARVDLDQVVRDASSRHRLDPDFVNSVIQAESNFQTHAVSRKGAQGLMQLMPGTASKLGVKDPFDPQANVEGGTAYLSHLLDRYQNDPIKALAAYNAGANRVEQYHGVPPYRETRAYVARIVRDFNAKKREQRKAAAFASKTAKKTERKPPSPQQAAVAKANKPS